jgi:hypothetical protein
MDETALDTARRDVSEGWDRVARQEALIFRLISGGNSHLVGDARKLLAGMMVTLRAAERRLSLLERDSDSEQ